MDMVHFIPPSQRRLVMQAAQRDEAPVLISGHAGTGKSHIARWIHQNSPRAGRPLVTATQDLPLSIQIRRAQEGSLVVPEIGEWPLSEQRVLEQFLITRSIPHPEENGMRMIMNVRIIATTAQDLDARSQGGLFNAALLKDFKGNRIDMPDLSKRSEEFEDIVLGILGEHAREFHKEHLRDLSPVAWKTLKSYHWPGNLRELRNVLRVAVVTAQGEVVDNTDLPDFGIDRVDFRATREEFEKIYITELLSSYNWEIDKACEGANINKDALVKKMKLYRIDRNPQVQT